jgi:hypothetical protein
VSFELHVGMDLHAQHSKSQLLSPHLLLLIKPLPAEHLHQRALLQHSQHQLTATHVLQARTEAMSGLSWTCCWQ